LPCVEPTPVGKGPDGPGCDPRPGGRGKLDLDLHQRLAAPAQPVGLHDRQSVDVVLPPGGRTFLETTSVARRAPWPWEGIDRRFRVTDLGGGGLPAATVDVASPGPALGYPRGVQITLARPRRLQPGVFELSGRADPLPAGHKVHLQRLGPEGTWRHVGVATVGPGHRFRLAARIERPGVHELIAVYHAQSPAFADDAVECGTRLRVG